MPDFNTMNKAQLLAWLQQNNPSPGTPEYNAAERRKNELSGVSTKVRGPSGGYLGINEEGAFTAPPEVSALEAAVLGAGRTSRSFKTGLENLFAGDEQKQEIAARLAEQDKKFGLVREQQPTASFLGEIAPYFAPAGTATTPLAYGAKIAANVPKIGRGVKKGLLDVSRKIKDSSMLDAALIGGGYGLLTPGEDQAEQAGVGTVLGAAGDVAGRLLGRAFDPVQSVLSTQGKKIIDWAKRKGYRLTPAQQFGSDTLRKVEASMEAYPPTAAPFAEASEHNVKISNRIAANSIGESADELSADVLHNAHKRIGARFDELTKDVEIPLSFDDGDLMSIIRRRLEEFDLDPSDAEFQKIINKILPKSDVMPFPRKIEPGDILTGAQYQKYRSAASRKASSAFKSGKADEGFAAAAVIDALDEITERALGGQALQSFRKARQQWRNKLALESPGVIHAGTGNVSPATLANVLNRTDKSGFMREANVGNNDLYAMARSGKLFKSIGDSGTTTRLFIPASAGVMGAIVGANTGGEDLGEKFGSAGLGLGAGVLAGMIAPRLASRGYMGAAPSMINANPLSLIPRSVKDAAQTGARRGPTAQYLYEPESTSERKLGLLGH